MVVFWENTFCPTVRDTRKREPMLFSHLKIINPYVMPISDQQVERGVGLMNGKTKQ